MKEQKLKEYIYKANIIHKNKYDYSKTNPKTCKDKCIVICPIHGEFETTLDNHINGKTGCPKCNKSYKLTQTVFIEKAQKIHLDEYNIPKYDYSKVNYINAKTKVCIICPKHGEFFQKPSAHLQGIGCPKCAHNYALNTETFIMKAQKIHLNYYFYDKVNYINSNTKVIVTCPKHGDFEVQPSAHLQGVGCPKCKGGVCLNTKEWIKKAQNIHNYYYDYSKVNYINAKTKVCIICPRHGEFFQTPDSHLRGRGCPKCKSSLLESRLINFFNKKDINYIYQFRLGDLGLKTIDFFLPKYNIAIECQGEQHFIASNFSNKLYNDFESFQKRQKLDELKYEICKKYNINLIYFTIPSLFHNKDININLPFYKDKIIFYDEKKLLNYILLYDNTTYNHINNNLISFYTYIHNMNKNFIINDKFISYQNKRFYFIPCIENENKSIAKIRIYCNKHNYESYFIYEDEWIYKQNIVLNKIKHICKLIDDNQLKIMGRKTFIKEINNKQAEIFLNNNHIQGFASASVYLGAFYKNELVAVMSFKKENKKDFYDLNRFASKHEYICQGIGGKIFNFFIKNYKPLQIKSFADRRWTFNEDNNLYTKLGFKKIALERPDYYYIEPSSIIRKHKFSFRKTKLNKNFNLPLSMTEAEMAKQLNLTKIWNYGLIKYIWTTI